jgi:HEAT repeat protein
MTYRTLAWFFAWCWVISIASARLQADEVAEADAKLLREHGIAADGPSLLEFLRKRSLSEDQREQITRLILQLGSNVFRDREAATKELIRWGPPALPALRSALEDNDAEIARRAQRCIQAIESGPGTALPAAVIRTLARRHPPGAVAALLRYAPFTTDPYIEEEILIALVQLARESGNLDTALLDNLKSPAASSRAAAGYATARIGGAKEREAVRPLLHDASPWVRLRVAQGFVLARDKAGVPALIDLLVDPSPDLSWRAEDLLLRIAQNQAPPANGDRARWRDAWLAWWNVHHDKIDLAHVDKQEVLLGLTVGISWNANKVWECGPDGKARWQLSVNGPMDAQVLPGNRVLLAEAASNKVVERDLQGNVVWEKQVSGEPLNCLRLPNGNTWIGTRKGALEVTRDGKELYHHEIPGYCHGVSRTPSGGAVFITSNGQIIELDRAGKRVRTVSIPHEGSWGDVEALPGGKYLVTNYGTHRVFEIDAAGKVLWEKKIDGACGARRLPNGNTLLACPQRMVEIDRSGNIVWQSSADGFVRRAHRR